MMKAAPVRCSSRSILWLRRKWQTVCHQIGFRIRPPAEEWRGWPVSRPSSKGTAVTPFAEDNIFDTQEPGAKDPPRKLTVRSGLGKTQSSLRRKKGNGPFKGLIGI